MKYVFFSFLKSRNIETIKKAMNFKLAYFIFLISEIVACLIFAFVIAWRIAVLFLGILPFIIISLILLVVLLEKYTHLEQEANGKTSMIAQEILSSIRTVITLGIQNKTIDSYSDKLRVVETCGVKKGLFRGIFQGWFSCVYFAYKSGVPKCFSFFLKIL
jgi:ABC-type multidrug transport system fused ATPase/permease subunit